MTDTENTDTPHFPYLLRGDSLTQLTACRSSEEPERPRGVVWGVDLADCTSRKHARSRWHQIVHELKTELGRRPSVRQVCIVCVRPTRFPQSALVRAPSGLAKQLHNDLERDRARYVQVFLIDVTGCDRPEVLCERLREAHDMRSGTWNDLSLTWEDIVDSSLHEAWARDSL
ncbi:MAG: hypothetical protein ACNYNX_10185 [Leucobacter sp.]